MGEEIITLILENKTNDSFFKILLINFNKIKTNIFKIEEYDLNCLSITLPSNAKNLLNFKEKNKKNSRKNN